MAAHKTLLLIMVIILACGTVSAATVTRHMPSDAEPGSTIEVSLRVTDAAVGKTFTLEETRPLQVEISDWKIDGAKEAKDKIQTRVKDLGYGWSFTPESTEATIAYTAKVSPSAAGALSFEAVYFDPNGFNKVGGSLRVERKQPVVTKGDMPPILTQNEGQGQAGPDKGGTPGAGAADVAKDGSGQARSILAGIVIAVSIIIIGLGIYMYLTRPRRRRDMFTHSFFFKK